MGVFFQIKMQIDTPTFKKKITIFLLSVYLLCDVGESEVNVFPY